MRSKGSCDFMSNKIRVKYTGVKALVKEKILKKILFDENNHWEKFNEKYGKRIRPVVKREIAKFRKCGEKEAGFTLFACPMCGEMKIVPHTCKGRFCTSCATGYTQEWSRETSRRMFNVPHRHIMFTIDERLWEIINRHRELLKDLMDLAVNILLEWLKKRGKVQSGAMVGIHTFGSRMNFNPHVHILVTEGGFDEAGKWIKKDFIPFKMLRKRWQATVMAMLRKRLSESELKRNKKLFQQIWDENPEGFVIYGPKNKIGNGNIEAQVGYIGRYMRRPAMALSRIINYDGQNVTFKYFDKTEQREKEETISVEEFISRIVKHIPDEQFKTIRYYGIYSRRGKKLANKLMKALKKSRKGSIKKENRHRMGWREKIKKFTGKDPLECAKCQEIMDYKGKVCLKEGGLEVVHAVDDFARKRLKELAGIYEPSKQKKKEIQKKKPTQSGWQDNQIRMFAM